MYITNYTKNNSFIFPSFLSFHMYGAVFHGPVALIWEEQSCEFTLL